MAWTHVDAIIKTQGDILCHFHMQKRILLWAFGGAIKQYDITPFDCPIVFFVTLHNTQRLHPTSSSVSLIGRWPGKAACNDFIVWRAETSSLLRWCHDSSEYIPNMWEKALSNYIFGLSVLLHTITYILRLLLSSQMQSNCLTLRRGRWFNKLTNMLELHANKLKCLILENLK